MSSVVSDLVAFMKSPEYDWENPTPACIAAWKSVIASNTVHHLAAAFAHSYHPHDVLPNTDARISSAIYLPQVFDQDTAEKSHIVSAQLWDHYNTEIAADISPVYGLLALRWLAYCTNPFRHEDLATAVSVFVRHHELVSTFPVAAITCLANAFAKPDIEFSFQSPDHVAYILEHAFTVYPRTNNIGALIDRLISHLHPDHWLHMYYADVFYVSKDTPEFAHGMSLPTRIIKAAIQRRTFPSVLPPHISFHQFTLALADIICTDPSPAFIFAIASPSFLNALKAHSPITSHHADFILTAIVSDPAQHVWDLLHPTCAPDLINTLASSASPNEARLAIDLASKFWSKFPFNV